MSQSSYLALPARLSGFQTGLAASQQLNKAWRQSSIISAMIAQFICDKTGLDAIDDGTVATLEARFIQALGNAARTPLTTDLNLFVSTTGNNNNNGTTSGTAVQTIQRATDIAQQQYDTQGHDIFINVASGTYTSGAVVHGPCTGGGKLRFVGNTGSPSSVVINLSSPANCFTVAQGAVVVVSGFQLIASVGPPTNGICIFAGTSATVQFDHVIFGTAAYAHIHSANSASIIPTDFANSVPYSIVGGAPYHAICASGAGSINLNNMVVTITGSPAFSAAFVWADAGYFASAGTTWNPSAGAASGPRYRITNGGVINTLAGGVLPGSTAGSGGTTSGDGWFS